MATRAGVSDSVLHDVFASAEECYRAAYREGIGRLSLAVADAARREQGWLERLRSGLVALLAFLDDEPSWARLLVLETRVDRALTLECGQQLQDVLTHLFEADGRADVIADSPILPLALTGELLAGGVFSVIRTSMLEHDRRKLVELAPALMAFIVAPYLGHAAAQAELDGRSPQIGEAPCVAAGSLRANACARAARMARAAELPIRATHRTTLVLRAIARTPYANNREIAQAAEITDEGQASKLLARLERQGVIENVGVGAARGEPNAWLLTSEGERVLELLAESFADRAPRRASRRVRGAR